MLRHKLFVFGVLSSLSLSSFATLSSSPSRAGTMYAGVSAGASNFNMPNFVYGSQTSGGSAVDFSTRQTTIHGELIFGIVFNNKSGSNPLDDDQPTDHQPKKKSKKSAPSPSDSNNSKTRNMRLETNVRFAQGSTTTTQVLPSVNFGTINGQTTFSSFAQETNNQLKSDLMYTDINILIKADIVPDSLQFGGTRIAITPYLGPSILLINQKFNLKSVPTNGFGGNSNTIEEELDSNLYGIKFGANADLELSEQFTLFAGANVSFLNGNTTFTGKQDVSGGWGFPGTYTISQQSSQTIRRVGGTFGGNIYLSHGSVVIYSDIDTFNSMPFADNPSSTQRSANVGYKSATISSVGLTYVYPF